MLEVSAMLKVGMQEASTKEQVLPCLEGGGEFIVAPLLVIVLYKPVITLLVTLSVNQPMICYYYSKGHSPVHAPQ